MRLLLDTHLLVWAATRTARLSAQARAFISDTSNTVHFSAASIWEISIKHGLQREDFTVNPERLRIGLLENGYNDVPVRSEHALAVRALPPLHLDPFDRLLLAQAAVEGFILLTSDSTVARYGSPAQLV